MDTPYMPHAKRKRGKEWRVQRTKRMTAHVEHRTGGACLDVFARSATLRHSPKRKTEHTGPVSKKTGIGSRHSAQGARS